MKILGLDISITATGYCVMNELKNAYAFGVIETSPKGYKSDIERFDAISTGILEVVDTGADAVFIENYAYAAKGNIMRIAELTGIIKHDLHCKFQISMGEKVFVVAPSTLKKYVLSTGVGEKGLILKYILSKWGVDIDDNNAGDAYVLARLGVDFLAYTGDDSFACEHKYEEECIKAVAKQNGIFLNKRKIAYKRKKT